MEGNEIPTGWPLGLGNINSRITAPPPQPASSRIRRCSSISSFSSSNLDTESTASFYPDESVSLGRLIGIRAFGGNKQQRENERSHHHDYAGVIVSGPSAERGEGICSWVLQHVIGRVFRRSKYLGTILSR